MADEYDTDRRGGFGAPTWAGGAALVLLGVLFLLQNLGLVNLSGNWWALFLLVPALILAGTAVTRYRAAGGRLTAEVRGALTGALFVGTVALMFLLGLDWGVWWPIFVVLAGVSALLNWASVARDTGRREP